MATNSDDERTPNLPTIHSFRTGDCILVDGDSSANMPKDDLLRETAENALESIPGVSDNADSEDLTTENYFVIAGNGVVKKLSGELLKSASTIEMRKNYVDNANISLDKYWTNVSGSIVMKDAVNYRAVPRIFLRKGKKYVMSAAPSALCWIGTKNGYYIALLSTIAVGNVITPTIDCYAYITFTASEYSYSSYMLVDGEVMPSTFHPYGVIFSVIIEGLDISQSSLQGISDVSDTADSDDLANANYFVIAGAEGVKKLPSELLENASTIETRKNYVDNANISLDKYWTNVSGSIVMKDAVNYRAVPRIFLQKGKKYVMSAAPSALCWIGTTNGYYIALLSTIAVGNVITPTRDCYAYITFTASEYDYNLYMLVDGEVMPSTFHAYNVIFSVKLKGTELVDANSTTNDNKTFYVKQSGGDFTSLKEAIETVTQYKNSTLYVEKNTYDLVTEFGQSYLDSTSTDKGLVLKNGVRVIFEPGSKVIFNYVGSNAQIHTNFSVFNSGIGGFTLENVIIEASNCRYCVHDERGNSSDKYINNYFNCEMTLDNSQNPDWSNPQVIGCGLCFGLVYISNCRFHSWITFHTNNGSSTSSKGKVIVNSCYFDDGGVMASSAGVSTEYTEIFVSNIHGVVVNLDEQNPPSSPNTINLRIYEWNNVH